MVHGWLIHAGRITVTYVDPSKGRNYQSPTLSGEKGVVYFALNALTSPDMFLREGDFIVWTLLAKHVDRLINLNPYELRLVVDIPLSSGDIIMYRKKPAEVMYSEKTRRFVSYRSPVIIFYGRQ